MSSAVIPFATDHDGKKERKKNSVIGAGSFC